MRARGRPRRRGRGARRARAPLSRARGGARMNVAMVIEMAADMYGDREAIAGDDASTYAELRARVSRRAAGLAAAAERTGARHVAYLGLSGASFVEHLLAAAWAGLPFLPLNYRTKPEELAPLLAAFHPLVFVHEETYRDKAEA